MPTFIHGKGTKVLINAADLSSWFQDTAIAATAQANDTTTYGNNSQTYMQGLIDGKITIKGLFDSTTTILGNATGVDGFLQTLLGVSGVQLITVCPMGTGSVGDRCYSLGCIETQYSIDSPVTDVVKLQVDGQQTGGVQSGVLLHPLGTETTSGNGTSVDNGAGAGYATTAFGGYGVLHVTANTIANTSVVKVQHSVDNTVWVDLVTFATIAASTPGSDQEFVTGTVNRYLRALRTVGAGGGNLTFAATFTRFAD